MSELLNDASIFERSCADLWCELKQLAHSGHWHSRHLLADMQSALNAGASFSPALLEEAALCVELELHAHANDRLWLDINKQRKSARQIFRQGRLTFEERQVFQHCLKQNPRVKFQGIIGVATHEHTREERAWIEKMDGLFEELYLGRLKRYRVADVALVKTLKQECDAYIDYLASVTVDSKAEKARQRHQAQIKDKLVLLDELKASLNQSNNPGEGILAFREAFFKPGNQYILQRPCDSYMRTFKARIMSLLRSFVNQVRRVFHLECMQSVKTQCSDRGLFKRLREDIDSYDKPSNAVAWACRN